MSEFAKNVGANAAWDGIKKAGAFLILAGSAAAYGIWKEFHSVTLVIGGALWFIAVLLTILLICLYLKDRFYPKKFAEAKAADSGSEFLNKAAFYQGRHPRPDLRDLVHRGGPVWIATHVAGRLCNEELLKKPVERLILQNPDSISIDLLASVIPDRSADQLRQQIKLSCEVAKQNGIDVRLFDGPMTSIIIGDALSSSHGWAQIEAFLPWTTANDRPSTLFDQKNYPDSFNTLVRMFNNMWANPVAHQIEELDVENFPVLNALNLRITNKRYEIGLSDSQLTLHLISKWENGRKQFSGNSLELPLVLYSDAPHLPYKTPRMFQLLEFKDKANPIVHGKQNADSVAVPIQTRGIWKFSMELRWGGGSMEITRFFKWDDGVLPTFCKDPS